MYVPNPPRVQQQMLAELGLKSLDELFADIPEQLKIKGELQLEERRDPLQLQRELAALADKNTPAGTRPCFLGAGAYDHYIPPLVDQLLLRSEFFTAYTPYQAELSQGILQAIFEYQTMICQLTGLDVANASLYDGASALAEAVSLAVDVTRRRKVLLAATLHPACRQVVQTYAAGDRYQLVDVPAPAGVLGVSDVESLLDKDTTCLVVQYPNFYGCVETALADLAGAVHGVGGLLIVVANPVALGLLKPPGQLGADVVVGEGQPLGGALSFGGPYLGFMAVRQEYVRRIPGRLSGQTVDREGRRAFVLTLQAREQHIRRARASSNICSNQALCALAATMYLAAVGPRGLHSIARRCHQLALYARQRLTEKGFELLYSQPFFHEFAIKVADPAAANRRLFQQGMIGGYELPGALLLAFTEKRTRAEIDRLVDVLGGEMA